MSVVLHLYNMYHVNSHNCLVLLHIIPHECLFVNCSHLDQSVYLTLSQLWRLKTPVTSFWILNCQKNILLNENKFLCWPICSGCVLTCSTSSFESALGQTAATKVEILHAVRTQLPPPLERMKFRCKQKNIVHDFYLFFLYKNFSLLQHYSWVNHTCHIFIWSSKPI